MFHRKNDFNLQLCGCDTDDLPTVRQATRTYNSMNQKEHQKLLKIENSQKFMSSVAV